jgi:uncharacterized SAM-binding protein YcdF (DUF218 family)
LRPAVRPKFLFTLVVLIGLGLLAGSSVLASLGNVLVEDDGPNVRADAIVVLGGDAKGDRIMKACQLAEAGAAPLILVSGPWEMYGVNEADLAIRYAVGHGCPEKLFQACRLRSSSTQDEAYAFARELRRRNLHSVIVVTSNYHTARSGRIFRRVLGNGLNVQVVSAPDSLFNPDAWWRERESRKTWLLEMTKTITGMVGM